MTATYRSLSREQLKRLAATFSARSFAGKVRVETAAHIRGDEAWAWSMVEADLAQYFKETGQTPWKKTGGILGQADTIMQASPGRFVGLPLHLWPRKLIYNRLRWLRGELTRLMLHHPKHKAMTEAERQAAIEKRKKQINTYADALFNLKPLHDEMERQRRVTMQRTRRQRRKRATRKQEIKNALRHSRESLRRTVP